jgi:hypothetical protein
MMIIIPKFEGTLVDNLEKLNILTHIDATVMLKKKEI